MTPKEKAKQLITKFYTLTTDTEIAIAKSCARQAANEVLEALNPSQLEDIFYWSEVKTEIETWNK